MSVLTPAVQRTVQLVVVKTALRAGILPRGTPMRLTTPTLAVLSSSEADGVAPVAECAGHWSVGDVLQVLPMAVTL